MSDHTTGQFDLLQWALVRACAAAEATVSFHGLHILWDTDKKFM